MKHLYGSIPSCGSCFGSPLANSLRRSVLASQPLEMELLLASPARWELRSVISFLCVKNIAPDDFIPICVKLMEKSVWAYNMYENGAENSKLPYKALMSNKISDNHQFPTKLLQKW